MEEGHQLNLSRRPFDQVALEPKVPEQKRATAAATAKAAAKAAAQAAATDALEDILGKVMAKVTPGDVVPAVPHEIKRSSPEGSERRQCETSAAAKNVEDRVYLPLAPGLKTSTNLKDNAVNFRPQSYQRVRVHLALYMQFLSATRNVSLSG